MTLRSQREQEQAEGMKVLAENVASVALAIETLELLLVDRGILKKDELMSRMTQLVAEKAAAANRLADISQPTGPDLGLYLIQAGD